MILTSNHTRLKWQLGWVGLLVLYMVYLAIAFAFLIKIAMFAQPPDSGECSYDYDYYPAVHGVPTNQDFGVPVCNQFMCVNRTAIDRFSRLVPASGCSPGLPGVAGATLTDYAALLGDLAASSQGYVFNGDSPGDMSPFWQDFYCSVAVSYNTSWSTCGSDQRLGPDAPCAPAYTGVRLYGRLYQWDRMDALVNDVVSPGDDFQMVVIQTNRNPNTFQNAESIVNAGAALLVLLGAKEVVKIIHWIFVVSQRTDDPGYYSLTVRNPITLLQLCCWPRATLNLLDALHVSSDGQPWPAGTLDLLLDIPLAVLTAVILFHWRIGAHLFFLSRATLAFSLFFAVVNGVWWAVMVWCHHHQI